MTQAIKDAPAKVQWREWNDETFALARRLDRPILLDIGAVWCHWCHVMEETVYDDPEVACLVNDLYIPVQVDTDRRPDINERYNQGGWPTTALLTPGGDILYGATYVPKSQFKPLLINIASFYRNNRAGIREKVKELRAQQAAALRHAQGGGEQGRTAAAGMEAPAGEGDLSSHIIADILGAAQELYDASFGGFGAQVGNKFPQPDLISFLLFQYSATRDKALLAMVERTLEAQALGGMYDHVGGGFHRYSVKPDWRIPHFEKMLKDQAGHIRNYLDAYQATGKELYREVAVQTLGYVESVLSDPAGGFYGSQDADIGPHDDGSYFTWCKDELRAILGVFAHRPAEPAGLNAGHANSFADRPGKPASLKAGCPACPSAKEVGLPMGKNITPKEYEVIVRYFGVDDDRNAMHEPHSSVIVGLSGEPASLAGAPNVKHALNVSFTLSDLARVLEMPVAEVTALRNSGLAKMRSTRARRPKAPFVDKHIFIDWSAMMVSSFLAAWSALGENKYRDSALKTLDLLLTASFGEHTGMAHYIERPASSQSASTVCGLINDQVYMARALLDAYAATGERRYLSAAERLMAIAKQRLYDDTGGGFWDIPAANGGIGNLAIRRKSLEANAVAADDLLRLWLTTGSPDYREMQRRTLMAFAGAYEHLGFMAAVYGEAVAKFLDFPVEMTVVGPLRDPRAQALLRACAAFYEPRKVVAPLDVKEDAQRIARLHYPADTHPRVFICVNKSCAAPITDPQKLATAAREFIEKTSR